MGFPQMTIQVTDLHVPNVLVPPQVIVHPGLENGNEP